MQIRRRTVLIYLIRPLPHVTVWWCVLCRILRGSFSLNVDEKGSYFSMQFKGQQIGMYDVVSTCFSWYCVQFIAWFAYQFCSLFKGRFWCHFDVNLWVKFLLFRRLFDSFSEPRLRYFEFAINWHFSKLFSMCSTKQRWLSSRAHIQFTIYGVSLRNSTRSTSHWCPYGLWRQDGYQDINRGKGQCITAWSFTRRHTRERQCVPRHEHDITWFTLVTR